MKVCAVMPKVVVGNTHGLLKSVRGEGCDNNNDWTCCIPGRMFPILLTCTCGGILPGRVELAYNQGMVVSTPRSTESQRRVSD